MPEIKIICTRQNGIYRAGVYHPGGVKVWPDGIFTEEQLASIRKEPLLVVQDSVSEEKRPDTPASAKNAAMALLRPFLKVSEEEAKLAIAELLHGGPEEMPPIVEPVVDWPLTPDADKIKAPRQSRRSKAGGE